MIGPRSLWRPSLFAATGVNFSGDPHLNDGLHVRWHVKHHLGLPYERGEHRDGGFTLAFRGGSSGSIADVDLFNPGPNSGLTIRSDAAFDQEAGLTSTISPFGFWQATDPDLFALFDRCQGLLSNDTRQLWNWRGRNERLALRRYVEDVAAGLQPDLWGNDPTRENSEACAVDIRFSVGGDPTPDDQPHVWIEALDRGGRLIDRDWVGRAAGGGIKTDARLRGAGLKQIRLQQAPGQPLAARTETRWVLCEDYCQRPLWDDDSEYWFRADPDYHTEIVMSEHSRPFQDRPDATVLSAVERALSAIDNQDIDELFSITQDVRAMAAYRLGFEAGAGAVDRSDLDESADNEDGRLELSLLQTLLASTVDPVMARILGLYAHIAGTGEPRGDDILIEAELPFFSPGNLSAIDEAVQEIVPRTLGRFFDDQQESLHHRRLCALIIAPKTAAGPVPAPSGFSSAVDVIGLPSQENPDQTELMVRSEISAPIDPEQIAPELTPIAYCVERQVSGGAFANVSETPGDPETSDDIGLLPAVYFPQRDGTDWQKPLKISDGFTLSSLQAETVQYRMKAFDIFGRPSDSVDGSVETITPPCKKPQPPLNPAARIITESGRLVMQIDFAVNSETQPLEANWERLEVTLHQLPEPDVINSDPRAPGAIDWPGKVLARRLLIDFLAGNRLDAEVAQSCVELEWNPGLRATATTLDDCAVLYPPPAPELSATAPLSMPFEETGLRSYRLRVVVGSTTGMAEARYRWCARFVTVGTSPLGGGRMDSDEACTTADWLIPAAPPIVTAPATSVVPLSSFPNAHGDSWYDLDLSGYGLADGDMVSIYMTRLHRLGESAAGLVMDGVLQNQGDLEALARASRKPFELITAPPFEYSSANRFYRINVPGDLRQTYIVAVVGSNAYLQEQPWSSAGITLFSTPERFAPPVLRFDGLSQSVGTSGPLATLRFQADLVEAPDPATPPRIQLFRRDLSSRAMSLVYVGETVGESVQVDQSEAAARFQFVIEDQKQSDWRSYVYSAFLVHFVPGRGYLKSKEPAKAQARAGWGGMRSPIHPADKISVAAAQLDGLEVSVDFDCGDLDFSLVRSLNGRVSSRFGGRVRDGRAYGMDADRFALAVVSQGGKARYRLTLNDENAAPVPVLSDPDAVQDGRYVLRVSYGQETTWTNRENVFS